MSLEVWLELCFNQEILDYFWLVLSTHLKNISQNGNVLQIRVKITNIWNHHLDLYVYYSYQHLHTAFKDLLQWKARIENVLGVAKISRASPNHSHQLGYCPYIMLYILQLQVLYKGKKYNWNWTQKVSWRCLSHYKYRMPNLLVICSKAGIHHFGRIHQSLPKFGNPCFVTKVVTSYVVIKVVPKIGFF